MPIAPVMQSPYFRQSSFGTIAGFSRVLDMPVRILGPILAGWIFNQTGSYILVFILLAVTLAIAGVMMFFYRVPKPPEPKSRVPEEASQVENAGGQT